jgi:hypothetical protein
MSYIFSVCVYSNFCITLYVFNLMWNFWFKINSTGFDVGTFFSDCQGFIVPLRGGIVLGGGLSLWETLV